MGVIYKITSPTNRIYVGKTYNLNLRIASHKHASKQGKNIILHNSVRKYGWDAHKLEIIEEIADELLNEREMFWIAELKTYCFDNEDGMNMTKGGDGQRSTWMHKTELRKFFSDKFSGEGNPFYGKKHSQETRKFLSEHAKIRNMADGRRVPEWGAEKGWASVRRPIICYNVYGLMCGEYASIMEAAKEMKLTQSQINGSLSEDSWANGLYFFRYKTEGYPIKIEVGEIKKQSVKRAVLTLTSDYEIVYEHPSAQEASEFWGIPKTTINRAAMYNWLVPIRTGHVFIYTDLYEEILKNAS